MKIVFAGVATLALLLGVLPSSAGGMRKSVDRNYTKGMCHQKIDPKGLKGAELKAAWKACGESPDTYN